ncbi:MAG: hypothetical protein U1D97_09885, partial [Desulfuromonadales bacterium]|nr:hypothetical protein [Desulfuromonadales bacterium]
DSQVLKNYGTNFAMAVATGGLGGKAKKVGKVIDKSDELAQAGATAWRKVVGETTEKATREAAEAGGGGKGRGFEVVERSGHGPVAPQAAKSEGRRGRGGRGGGPEHAKVQKDITDVVHGRQEVRVYKDGRDTEYRIVDNLEDSGRIHQVGDMRSRGGYHPSARERGAIEDLRKVVGDGVDIIYHDKRGVGPSLINPDKYLDWKPAPKRHRRF